MRAALAIQAAIARLRRGAASGYGFDLTVRDRAQHRPGRADGRRGRRRALQRARRHRQRRRAAAGARARRRHRRRARDRAPGAVLRRARVARRGRAARPRAPAARGARRRARAARRRCASVVPVVGRAGELAVLDEACQAIADGSGAIVSITGESGIGKSRLVVEARRRFGDRIRFLEGRGGSYAESFPYWPVRDLLRDWLSIGVDAPEARVRLELKAALGGLGDGRGDGLPVPRPAARPAARGRGRAPRCASSAARPCSSRRSPPSARWCARLAAERPLCIVVDDLQWADSLTLELVEDLLALTDEAAARRRPDLPRRPRPALVAARRARARATSRTATARSSCARCPRARAASSRRRSPRRRCPGSLADLLAERAGGNPFFLEEALQDLIERGALRRRDGAWALTDGQVAVPTLVQGALQARLDRLPPRTREVVSVSSAIGRGFGLPLLERLLPHEQVVAALSDLMRLDLIVEVSRRPAPEYRFRHGLVQEVAYGSLLEPARRSLHRRIGEALETLYGEADESFYGPLARHFAEADEPERAARYSLAAGDAARAVYADHEAIEHYRRARTFLRRLDDPARERDTLFKIALVRHLAFDYARAGQAYDAAFDCSTEERSERVAPTAEIEIALIRPDSYAPGDTLLERLGDRHRAALPRPPADRPRPQRRAGAGPEHERLGRRSDLPLHAARGRLLERRASADRRRLRVRLAHGCARRATSRRSCSTTSPRPRRSTTGRSRCTCTSRATTSRTCSPRTGPTPGRATARTRSAPPGGARSRSSATARSCSPR